MRCPMRLLPVVAGAGILAVSAIGNVVAAEDAPKATASWTLHPLIEDSRAEKPPTWIWLGIKNVAKRAQRACIGRVKVYGQEGDGPDMERGASHVCRVDAALVPVLAGETLYFREEVPAEVAATEVRIVIEAELHQAADGSPLRLSWRGRLAEARQLWRRLFVAR
jgi:hypothetical protein